MPVTLRTSSSQKSNDFVFGAIFLITDDFGKTWKKSGRLNVPHHKAGGTHMGTRWNHDAMEPSAVALKDGTLLCLLRTSLDNLWQSRSKDGGRTHPHAVLRDVRHAENRQAVGRKAALHVV